MCICVKEDGGEHKMLQEEKKKVLFTVREPHTLSVLLVLVIQHRRGAGELQRPDDGGRERETAAPVIYSQVPTKHISTI